MRGGEWVRTCHCSQNGYRKALTNMDMIARDDDTPVPQSHKDLLDARERDVKEGKAKFLDWDIAKQQIAEEIVSSKKSRRDKRK
jgi:hypothetical protein